MNKLEKFKEIIQNADPNTNIFFNELKEKIQKKNIRKLKSDFISINKSDLSTIKKLFVMRSTYKEKQETTVMRLIYEYKIIKDSISVNINKDFLEFLQKATITGDTQTEFVSTKKHTNTIYKLIDDTVNNSITYWKFWQYFKNEDVLRNELGISKTYKQFSLLKNNILIPAQKEINKKSKYNIYYDYSYYFYKNRQIRIKIFKKN
ncbi:hypothetical protein IBE33_09505 [Francisella philomiragia]|uniref:hypothetical protein n=1 Tax=Francisella philomiragia TaxID=28110 RepID=UPI00190562EB|nr:hypothetical protein [Francisella philomiragia]MBK2341741.1 hypothetical protein [Francisella philomiragia]